MANIENTNVEKLESEIKQLEEECELSNIEYLDKMIVLNRAEIIFDLSFIVPTLTVMVSSCINMGMSKDTAVDIVKTFLAPLFVSGVGGLSLGYLVSNIYTYIKTGFNRSALSDYIEMLNNEYYDKVMVLDEKEIELSNIKKKILTPKKES